MEDLINNLIDSIENFNSEEAIYWAHLMKQKHPENLPSFPLSSIFKGFQLGNHELSTLLCELIWKIIKQEDFPIIIEKYQNELIEGLRLEDDEEVGKLCLKIVFELGIGNGHQVSEHLLKYSLQLLNSSKYSVSSYLIDLIAKNRGNLSENIQSLLLQFYSLVPSNESIVKFRYLELFQKLNLKGTDKKTELFEKYFSDLKTILLQPKQDILFTANVLQIIHDCIERKEQFDLFDSEGIIDLIVSLLSAQDSSDNLTSKSLDILANCAINQCFNSEYISSKGINRLVYNIEPITTSSVYCSSAIASICPNDSEFISNLFYNSLIHGTSSIQLAAFHGLGIYFKSTQIDSAVHVSVLNSLNLSGSWLVERLNSTFDEQKSASYFAFKSIISASPDSFKFILNRTNLFSVLLDRSNDTSQLGLKWKYGIIEDVHVNPNLFNCLNAPLKEKVVNYLRNGITFIPKTSQVAYEGQT